MTTIDRYVRLLLAVFVLFVPCAVGCARDEDIRTVLQAIPGLRVKGEQTASGGRLFELTYRQPIDHDHPERGEFDQRLTLMYRATDRPMVLYTSGYDLTSNVAFRAEPTELVGGNQIVTEQRYFGSSRPASPDWTTLDIRQAAADHHRLIVALRPIFRGAWISAGASKGGMASIYHRRFYPDDVVGTIAYSAPNILDDADPTAYDRFVAEVGTPECRAAIIAVQREILLRRKEIDDRLTDWAQRSGYAFQTVGGVDRVVELATLQVPMYFWMHRGVADCGAIPPAAATTETLYTWLDDLVQPASYTDQGLAVALPSFYQLGTQLGTARYSAPGLTDLLRYPNIQDMRNYVPQEIPLRFDPDAMLDIDRWVRSDSTGLIFVYGANDPTRAKPFRLGPTPRGDAIYLAPAANHLARIANLTAADQAAVLAALTRWSHGSGSH